MVKQGSDMLICIMALGSLGELAEPQFPTWELEHEYLLFREVVTMRAWEHISEGRLLRSEAQPYRCGFGSVTRAIWFISLMRRMETGIRRTHLPEL